VDNTYNVSDLVVGKFCYSVGNIFIYSLNESEHNVLYATSLKAQKYFQKWKQNVIPSRRQL